MLSPVCSNLFQLKNEVYVPPAKNEKKEKITYGGIGSNKVVEIVLTRNFQWSYIADLAIYFEMTEIL